MKLYANILLQKEIKTQVLYANLPQALYRVQLPKHAHTPCKIHFPPRNFECKLTLDSDVLRRRFQINTMSGMGYQYKGIFDAVKVIIAQEGIKGMYKGIVPNLLKVAPSMASSWLSFEMTRDFLLTLRADNQDL